MAAWNEFQRQRRNGERQGDVPPPISIDMRVVPSLAGPSHTDELTFFSATLAKDLAAHAQQRQNGLMPDDSKVAAWLAGLDRQVVTDLRAP